MAKRYTASRKNTKKYAKMLKKKYGSSYGMYSDRKGKYFGYEPKK